ncbi:MAG: carbon storage regulator [Planctomycetaceae bacterium]
MLVLKRKFGQSVTIADGITVTVLGTGSNGVCLGIEAPRCVPVHRSEILRDVPTDGTLTTSISKGHPEQ